MLPIYYSFGVAYDDQTLDWKRTAVRVTIDGRQVLNEPVSTSNFSTQLLLTI